MTAILPFSIEPAAPAAPARAEAVAPADAAAFGASLEQALLAAVLAQPQAKPVDQSTLAELARALMEFGGEEAVGAEQGEASVQSGEAATSPADGAVSMPGERAVPTPGERTVPTATAGALATTPITPALTAATPDAAEPMVPADLPRVATLSPPTRTPAVEPVRGTSPDSASMPPAAPAVVKQESLLNDAAAVRLATNERTTQPLTDRRAPASRDAAAPKAETPEGENVAADSPACSASTPVIEVAVSATGALTPELSAQMQQLAASAQLPLPSPRMSETPKPAPAEPAGAGAEARAAETPAGVPTGARAANAAAEAAASLLIQRNGRTAISARAPETSMRAADAGAQPDPAAGTGSGATDAAAAPSEAVALGGAPLPAGVRVLELQAEAARRRTITGAGKREARAQPAPRTAEQAGAELQAGTAMPSVAAEAIEQLRRPALARTPDGRTRDEGSRRDGGLPTIPSARTTDASNTPVLTLDTRDPDAKAATEVAAEGRNAAEPSLRQQAEQQVTGHALPAASAGHAGPSLSGSSAMPRPVTVDGVAAPVAPAPTEPLRPSHDRISVRLGDEVGAPVVRIDIRGEQVNARIVTPDAQLAHDLGRGVQELATALEARGFEGARVQVRGTASAYEQIGPAQLAGSGIAESRSASETRSDDRHQAPEDRAQGWREAEAHERRQGRRPRRTYEDEEQP